MENTRVGWAKHTWNPWWGCDKISRGCKNCYIGPIMKRGGNIPFDGPMRTSAATWKKVFSYNRKAEKEKRKQTVFTCSMSDFFHKGADPYRPEAWDIIRQCPWLIFLVLTKRTELIADRLPLDWGDGYKNVWLGATVEASSNVKRIHELTDIPATVRFISAEPLLSEIQLSRFDKIHWLIAGGESGGQRRYTELEWYESLYSQCKKFQIPFYMKQDTSYRDGQQGRIPDKLWNIKQFPKGFTNVES